MFKSWDHAFWERPDWTGHDNLRDPGSEPFWMREEAAQRLQPEPSSDGRVWVPGADVPRFSSDGFSYCRNASGYVLFNASPAGVSYLMERRRADVTYLNAPIMRSVASAGRDQLATGRLYDPVEVYAP